MKMLLHYVSKKDLFKLLFVITLQQILAAGGTYALAKAGFTLSEPSAFAFWVLTSIVLFIMTPGFGILIRRMEVEIGFSAYRVYLQDNLFQKSGQALLWREKDDKDRFLTSLNNDAHEFLSLMLLLMTDVYAFGLSIVLGVLVLSTVIDVSLLPAFAASGALSYLLYNKYHKKVDSLFCSEQAAKLDLGSHILRSWDHVLLNNKTLNQKYADSTDQKNREALCRTVKSVSTAESLVFALGVVAGLPVLVSAIWILHKGSLNPDTAVLTALLATLPRQLQYLGVFRSIFLTLTSILGVSAKFDVLIAGTRLSTSDIRAHIQADKITWGQTHITNFDEVLKQAGNSGYGRHEIRGPNGAGKSSMLLLLNDTLPSSFYLPANPDFDLDKGVQLHSTGERLLAHIEFLKTLPEEVILLDEWDANLDAANLKLLSNEIDLLSKTKKVIEVRHRHTV